MNYWNVAISQSFFGTNFTAPKYEIKITPKKKGTQNDKT